MPLRDPSRKGGSTVKGVVMGEERQASMSLEHRNRGGFDHMVLITRLGIMVLMCVLVAAMSFSTWYQMDVTARRNIERLTGENQAHSLDFGARSFSKYLSATTQMARQIATTMALSSTIRTANLTKISVIEQEVSPLILATLLSSPNASFCRFQTLDGLVSGFRRFDDGAIRHFFANRSSPPPSSSTGYSTMPLFIQDVDLFGNPTSRPKPAAPGDFRETAPYRETMITGKMAWGLVWAYNSTLVFLSAQVVRNPVTNVTLGVALGTSTTVTLTTLLASIRPQHAGLLYVFEAESGRLISSSDMSGLYNSTVITSESLIVLAANASNPIMRDSARFLVAEAAVEGWPELGVTSFHDNVRLAGGEYYLSHLQIVVEARTLVTVMAIPRSVVWDDIDRTSSRELTIISATTAGVLVLGCVLIVLLTCRVSREMLLRAELINSLQLKEKAEKASDYKSQFLAAMSHDVRTPLCCIIGLLEVLLGDSRLQNEQRSSLKQVRLCALQLLDLLKSILDLSKVETGKLTLETGPFDLGQELEALVDMFAVQCAKKNVALALDLDDCLPRRVVGDCARVRQILANLVGNAVTFTHEGHIVVRAYLSGSQGAPSSPKPLPKVLRTLARTVSRKLSLNQVRASSGDEGPRDSGLSTWIAEYANKLKAVILPGGKAERSRNITVVFEVDDTGVGIPPNRRETVLGSFTQGSRHSGGYGLGLAMVKNLVAIMGGAIRIEDKQGPGSLFRFHITLELSPEHSTEQDANASYCPTPIATPKGAPRGFGERLAGRKTARVAPRPSAGSNVSTTDYMRQEVSLLPQLEGSSVLLLKGDYVGREAAAAWMARRHLRVYEAERWGGLRETFRRLLGKTVRSSTEGLDADADPSIGPINKASQGGPVRRPSEIRSSETDEMSSKSVLSAGDQLFGQLLDRDQTDRGTSQGPILLILDTAVVPGFPSPEALSIALRSLMEGYDPTAVNAPRVMVAWLVSFALPGAIYEEMRCAAGCRIITYDVLHPSRLLSLLTAMVSDNPNPDSLLGSALPAAPPVLSNKASKKVQKSKRSIILNEEEREELMIQAGMAFASTRGAVDEKGPDSTANPAASANSFSVKAADSLPRIPNPIANGVTGIRATSTLQPVSRVIRNPVPKGEPKEIVSPGHEPGGADLALAGVHVLIVEDTVMLRKLATTILTRVGAKVFAVENGRQAVNAILTAMEIQLGAPKATPSLSEFGPPADALAEALRTSGCFDLVLMDCQMPVLDGYGATTEIRQLEEGEKVHVPIVALTAHAMATDKEKCLGVGMDGYLTKPINVPLLVSTIKSFVKREAAT
ncbi:Signal transduction histidine kinase [Klebsormidium nitens]|uniref:histidine kinase n=1 Tax=Klebsormidium nitens TaxID=105231 RepID=A0A1Y1I805_KLENI|nr:Signal transduction histidine kinase [Klebsormidium nitens]|eukprot:GAQ86663.1 Signal transduction histidine kinase [Klebsormidium nitens]